MSNFYENGYKAATQGALRSSGIKRPEFNATPEWLDAMREWYVGWDAATYKGLNPKMRAAA